MFRLWTTFRTLGSSFKARDEVNLLLLWGYLMKYFSFNPYLKAFGSNKSCQREQERLQINISFFLVHFTIQNVKRAIKELFFNIKCHTEVRGSDIHFNLKRTSLSSTNVNNVSFVFKFADTRRELKKRRKNSYNNNNNRQQQLHLKHRGISSSPDSNAESK